MKFKFIVITIMTFIFGFVSPVHAETQSTNTFTITNVYVEQIKQDLYFNIHLSGQETSSETFKLIFTSGNPLSTWKYEQNFENKFIKTGVRFNPWLMITQARWGNYALNVQAITPSGITSNLYSFSFNYSQPNWQQAGCDNLWGLNQEALEWDFNAAHQANFEVQLQRDYPTVSKYGCPNQLAWKWATVKTKKFVWQYTLCNDGWHSSSTGSGTCSWHSGINSYRGYYKTVNVKRPQFYWVY